MACVYVGGPGLVGPGRPLAWGHMDGHGGVIDRSLGGGGGDERGLKGEEREEKRGAIVDPKD